VALEVNSIAFLALDVVEVSDEDRRFVSWFRFFFTDFFRRFKRLNAWQSVGVKGLVQMPVLVCKD